MTKKEKEKKEKIFDLMTGSLVLETLDESERNLVADEFAKGEPCELLYNDIYAAKCRIYDRLGVREDSDVELIISNLLDIGKKLAMKMYDYGALYGTDVDEI